jgi:hypothetical protein
MYTTSAVAHSVGIVRLRTQATEFSLVLVLCIYNIYKASVGPG